MFCIDREDASYFHAIAVLGWPVDVPIKDPSCMGKEDLLKLLEANVSVGVR